MLFIIKRNSTKIMKKSIVLAFCILPIAAYSGYGVMNLLFRAPTVPPKPVDERKIEGDLKKINASVLLSKWQVEKMMGSFKDDDHPSDMRVFTSVVNRSADGWRISSTHLVRNSKNVVLPTTDYHVIDSSYIDFSGNLRECVEYASSYKDHHDYIVVPLRP
jgi:hypothetical protein